jgi:acyl carrier protein
MNEMDTIKEFIVENFLFGEGGQVADDTSFLGSNIIDSTGMLELVSFLEERYSVSINDEELIPENLDSLNNIGHFLNRKLNGSFMESTTPILGPELPSLEPPVPSLEPPVTDLEI